MQGKKPCPPDSYVKYKLKIYQSCQELLHAKVNGPSLCSSKLCKLIHRPDFIQMLTWPAESHNNTNQKKKDPSARGLIKVIDQMVEAWQWGQMAHRRTLPNTNTWSPCYNVDTNLAKGTSELILHHVVVEKFITGLEIIIKIWVSIRKTCLRIWISLVVAQFPLRKHKYKVFHQPDNPCISSWKTCSKIWVSVTIFGCPGNPETH